jgi:hypothetical protein
MNIYFNNFNKDTELNEQRSLFLECFPETINSSVVTVEHYHWKFHSKSDSINSVECVAKENNKIIGYYAAIPFVYNYFENIITAAMVCDVMTGVKARGKGVFVNLGKYSTNEISKKGFEVCTGFPIRPEVLPGHIKAGWVNLFKLPLYGSLISFRSFLKNKGLDFFYPFIDFIYNSASFLFEKIVFKNKVDFDVKHQITNQNFDYTLLDEFYKKWVKQVPIGLIKDNIFLKWRLGAPNKFYHIFYLILYIFQLII